MSQNKYETLVVATDLSDPSHSALRHAARLSAATGARVLLVHVVEDRMPPIIPMMDPEQLRGVDEEHRQHALSSLADCAATYLPDCQVETIVRQGVVHQEIIRLAEERQADMIVLGMHGHGFLMHALTGSTAERILHHAPCPVLVTGYKH